MLFRLHVVYLPLVIFDPEKQLAILHLERSRPSEEKSLKLLHCVVNLLISRTTSRLTGLIVRQQAEIFNIHFSTAMLNEMLDFGNGVVGLALNLEETEVGAIILGDYRKFEFSYADLLN